MTKKIENAYPLKIKVGDRVTWISPRGQKQVKVDKVLPDNEYEISGPGVGGMIVGSDQLKNAAFQNGANKALARIENAAPSVYRDRGKAAYRAGLPNKPDQDMSFQEKVAWQGGWQEAKRKAVTNSKQIENGVKMKPVSGTMGGHTYELERGGTTVDQVNISGKTYPAGSVVSVLPGGVFIKKEGESGHGQSVKRSKEILTSLYSVLQNSSFQNGVEKAKARLENAGDKPPIQAKLYAEELVEKGSSNLKAVTAAQKKFNFTDEQGNWLLESLGNYISRVKNATSGVKSFETKEDRHGRSFVLITLSDGTFLRGGMSRHAGDANAHKRRMESLYAGLGDSDPKSLKHQFGKYGFK